MAFAAIMVTSCSSKTTEAQAVDEAAKIQSKIENCTNPDSLVIYLQQAQDYYNKLQKEGNTEAANAFLNSFSSAVQQQVPDFSVETITVGDVVDDANQTVSDAQEAAENAVNDAKEAAENKVNEAKEAAENKVNEAKDAAKQKVDEAKDAAGQKVDEAKQKAADAVQNGADKLKGALGK